MKRQVSSAKSTNRSFGSCTGLSPYEKNYKGCLRAEQRELIFEHQRVSKMTRSDLEDQYINLCDEHYAVKRENRFNQEKIKRLLTKISRISSVSLSDIRASLNGSLMNRPPRDNMLLSFEEKLQICIFDLEIQNAHLNERLQTLCKRHGLPAPAALLRPSSEMYSKQGAPTERNANRLRTRAQSCNHINGVSTNRFNEEDLSSPKAHPLTQSPETVPVKLVDDSMEKINNLEEKNERLGKLLSDFSEQLEVERTTNKDLVYKLKELEIRRHITENIELINVKEKFEQAKCEFRKRVELMESSKERNDKVLIEDRLKLVEVNQKLNEEEEKSKKLSLQVKQIEGFRKQIDDLREQLIESESEKHSLKTQHERFALLLKESVHQGDRIQTLKEKNSLLQSQLDEAKANEMAVTHSKSELVDKILKIQDENDRISIELEGLQSLLAQDDEYKHNKQFPSKHIDKRLNFQDVVLDEEQTRMVAVKEQHFKSPQKRLPQTSIGVNTEPVSIIKEGRVTQIKFEENNGEYSEAQSSVSSESPNNSTADHNLTFYDEPLTMDSERSSLINFVASIKRREVRAPEKKKTKPQPNNLELLERAALYGSYSGSTTKYKERYESLDSHPSADAYPIPSPTKRSSLNNQDPRIIVNLQSFIFNQKTQNASTYILEVTMSPDQTFHSSAFQESDLDVNFQKRIKIAKELLKTIGSPDGHSIRFLLLEKATSVVKERIMQSPPSSISSSPPDETITSPSTNLVQCQEIAYGSINYTELLRSITETQAERCSVVYEVPFNTTKFPHPEIAVLTVRFLIDGVPRIRQLLTHATQP